MLIETKSCGCDNSPNDSRDWIYSLIENKNENNLYILDLREYLQDITDQGKHGSCVTHVITCIEEYHVKMEEIITTNNKLPELINYRLLSSRFIYNQRSIYPKSSMNPREAFKILQKSGMCFEREYEYEYESDRKQIENDSDILKKNINFFKILNYARINTIEDAQNALYNDGPCLISLSVYNYDTRFWDKQIANQKIVGNHAVTFVGYDEYGFILNDDKSLSIEI